ncbi:GNAT family acetyltransferase [Sphingomonas sp. JC676]|uniref:GNAT family acetyltransferase n=1 Tax=Sphingomonas sp. JC676 TaxID=2768065 RepID=UPI0016578354|nr:GNAT family acetyltransferase [Sphingomonas sp. JC676]MBC9033620.1 GNAT family acetyltransferase [Sphingomonas sp. JC676]
MIAEASIADAGETIALWRACGLVRPWNDPMADFHLALESGSSTILIARAGEVLAGSAMIGFDGHRGWVYYVAVAEAQRGTGLGRKLMTAAEEWLRARGCPKIQLMVRTSNHDAIGFYEALGLDRQEVVTLGRFLK